MKHKITYSAALRIGGVNMNWLFDIIMDWVIMPLIDFLVRRQHSGRWHVTHLFPVATATGCGLIWAGAHWSIGALVILGVLVFVIFGALSLLTLSDRWKGAMEDARNYRIEKEVEAEVEASIAKVEAQKEA